MKYIFIYILILNYYLLKTDTVVHLISDLVKYLSIPSHMTAPPLFPPKCGMSCPGLSGAPVDAEVGSGVFLSFAIGSTLRSPGCFQNDPPASASVCWGHRLRHHTQTTVRTF